MPETELVVANASIQLHRHPIRSNETLRAWDSADEYLLQQVQDHRLHQNLKIDRILILNDQHGAVTLGMSHLYQGQSTQLHVVSDSIIAQQSIELNRKANSAPNPEVFFYSTDQLTKEHAQDSTYYDLALIKIPKSLEHLEYQLQLINPYLNETTRVIAGAMTKNIHNSTIALFNKIIGQSRTSLAKKKSRLIIVDSVVADNSPASMSHLKSFTATSPQTTALKLFSLPGVFAHGRLDYGASFMLQHMRITGDEQSILDLGCGSGCFGFVAAQIAEQADITFIDEFYPAIQSVQHSISSSFADQQSRFTSKVQGNINNINSGSIECVLLNPPFHDASARTSHVAHDMFLTAKRVLKFGGNLQVIANRNLGYRKQLNRVFGNCQQLAQNQKFVVLRSIKRHEA